MQPKNKQMKIKSIILLLLFTSCHPLFCSWQNGYEQLNYEPLEREIIGQYELSEKSKSYLNEEYQTWPLRIELSENKEYKLLFENNSENLADKIPENGQKGNETKKNVKGKWFLGFNDKEKFCDFELEGICVEPLCKKDGKISITITIGDGDECNGIVYEKVE
jgi:hypothetical protein